MQRSIYRCTINGKRPIFKNKKYAPATGIQADFEKILTAFVDTKSVRYTDFVKIWREKKLSLIWAGRLSHREAQEFMEECFKTALKMFLPPYGFQARVGALYLMYGLFFTQPCLPRVKIRLTAPDWKEVQELQKELVNQSHHDTHFILQKLITENAFHFCSTSEEPRGRVSSSEEVKYTSEVLRDDKQAIADLISDDKFEELCLVHSQYHQLKVRLAGPDASRPDRSLDVLQDKFPTSITEQIKNHYAKSNKKESAKSGGHKKSLATIPENGEAGDSDSDADYVPGGSVGERRARLKALAYRGEKNTQRRKHRNLVLESSPDNPHQAARKQKHGKNSNGETEDEEDQAQSEDVDNMLHMPLIAHEPKAKQRKRGRPPKDPQERAKRRRKRKVWDNNNPSRKKSKSEQGSPIKSPHVMQNESQKTAQTDLENSGASAIKLNVESKLDQGSEGIIVVPKSDEGLHYSDMSPTKQQTGAFVLEKSESNADTTTKPKKRGRPPKQALSSPREDDSSLQESEAIGESSVTPTKPRKPGRPPKQALEEDDSLSETSEDYTATSTKPRKPGRPGRPKHTLLKYDSMNETSEDDTAKPTMPRKRGRPPKHTPSSQKEEDSRTGDAAAPPTPKKRGRPPKFLPGSLKESDSTGKTSEDATKPRKRGRPPKQTFSTPMEDESNIEIDGNSDDDATTTPLPKKRGRPPKFPPASLKESDSTGKTSEDATTTATKPSKRGRPPKPTLSSPMEDESNTEISDNSDDDATTTPLPKKRRRPSNQSFTSPEVHTEISDDDAISSSKQKKHVNLPKDSSVFFQKKGLVTRKPSLEEKTTNVPKWKVVPLQVKDPSKLKKSSSSDAN